MEMGALCSHNVTLESRGLVKNSFGRILYRGRPSCQQKELAVLLYYLGYLYFS